MIFLNTIVLPIYMVTFATIVLIYVTRAFAFERPTYITLAVVWSLMAAFRPFGISPDDLNYEFYIKNACEFSICGFDQPFDFDIGYFYLIAIVKDFIDGEAIILTIAGINLMLKMIIIGSMTSYSLISLFAYVSIFFIYHDITQLRASIAVTFFLLALYLFTQTRIISGITSFAIACMMQLQALVSFVPLTLRWLLREKYWWGIVVIVAAQLISAVGFAPTSAVLSVANTGIDERVLEIAEQLDQEQAGGRGTNLLILILMSLFVPALLQVPEKNRGLLSLCFYSVVAGYILYWIFSGSAVASNRILQFMWVPLVILTAMSRDNLIVLVGSIGIASAFFILTGFIAPFLY